MARTASVPYLAQISLVRSYTLATQRALATLAVLVVTAPCLAAGSGPTPILPDPESLALWARQILVVFHPDPGNPSLSDIAATVAAPASNVELHQQLGHPTGARKMLSFESSPRVLAQLAADPHSPRAVLERYMVLTYANSDDAELALGKLRADARVESAQHNNHFTLSATPNDTYFAGGSGSIAGSFQWGMQALNFPAAWEIERGTAYIAPLDIGIHCVGDTVNPCVTHPDLVQNFREQFSHNSFVPIDINIVERHVLSYSGHGTHVAGILAATPEYGSFTNGQTNTGVAGACWTCSLAVMKINLDDNTISDALTWAVDHGLQVLNMSFGDEATSHDGDPTTVPFTNCSDGTNPLTCTAIAHAVSRDVLIVAASGNWYENRIQFPAMHADTIAVGGIQYGGSFWSSGYGNGIACTGAPQDQCGSNYGTQTDGSKQVVAPAKDVVSTFRPGWVWNPSDRCGDTYDGPTANDLSSGYGDCTGTSMAAPHITGLVALMRSANPLMSRGDIKSALYASASSSPCTGNDSRCGAGIPDARKAVQLALGPAAKNRLTPLFSFYSAAASDHVYTIAPQMGAAAVNAGQLLPQPPGGPVAYDQIGNPVPKYSLFPGTLNSPRAMVSVFTSHVDPTNPAAELVPLYRMSWKCSSPSSCSHVSHAYTTDPNGVAAFVSVGYAKDGIEGYIYPKTKPQPVGTVKLCRKYSSTTDDYILFPGTGVGGGTCGNGDGFTKNSSGVVRTDYTQLVGNTDWIGWVYPVRQSQSICANAIPCGALAAITQIIGD